MGIKDKNNTRKCEREIEKWLKKIDKLDKEIDELAKLRKCQQYNENVSADNDEKSNNDAPKNTTNTTASNCNSNEASVNSDKIDNSSSDNTTEHTNFQNISDFVKQQIKLDRTVVSNAMGRAVDAALFKLGIVNDAIRIVAANTIISLQISNAINDITDIKGNSMLIRAFGEQVKYSPEMIDAVIELVNSIDLNKLSEYTNEELANDNIVAPILEKYEKKSESDKDSDKSSMDFSKMIKPIRLGMDFSEFIKSDEENQSEAKAS